LVGEANKASNTGNDRSMINSSTTRSSGFMFTKWRPTGLLLEYGSWQATGIIKASSFSTS
ncbi:15283_t:CDS:2, partial [Cetraspora pellucida]